MVYLARPEWMIAAGMRVSVALDLCAEQTVVLLARCEKPKEEKLGKLIWLTNQYNELQQRFYREIIDDKSELHKAVKEDNPSYLSFRTFSGLAQNTISMAIIIVFYICGFGIYLLYSQLDAL